VEHGRCGLLVEERDFEALATSMKTIVRSPLAFREMGALASESVAANFEQREQIRQLETHYDEAVALSAAEERVSRPAQIVVEETFPEQVPAK
jgi:glycosyltransferase involved in cell wall biosynthesis